MSETVTFEQLFQNRNGAVLYIHVYSFSADICLEFILFGFDLLKINHRENEAIYVEALGIHSSMSKAEDLYAVVTWVKQFAMLRFLRTTSQ